MMIREGPLTMNEQAKKAERRFKGESDIRGAHAPLKLAAIGLEAEFTLHVDGRAVKPEKIFRDPRGFIRAPLMHREGTSFHLPTAGAVYFDTGVIELATPVIEIDRGCAARAGRSLWESIIFVRDELDAWERRTGRTATLGGFSTHYNVSFEPTKRRTRRSVDDLALLLVHMLPIPVMIIATNRRSTGVGMRPRGDRIEVTVDFTPSPALMIATAALITGVVRSVMEWRDFSLDALKDHALPRVSRFRPVPHTTRKGWLARAECFERNPFETPVDDPVWDVENVDSPRMSMREIGRSVFYHFQSAIRRVSDPFTFRLLHAIFDGRTPILLELPERPAAYDDVGRLCFWDDLFPERMLSRSRYERVLIRAIAGKVLRLDGEAFVPVGMRGWSEVVFERLPERSRHSYPIDYLVQHLDRWEEEE